MMPVSTVIIYIDISFTDNSYEVENIPIFYLFLFVFFLLVRKIYFLISLHVQSAHQIVTLDEK